jgi:hypothetical protein
MNADRSVLNRAREALALLALHWPYQRSSAFIRGKINSAAHRTVVARELKV